MADEEGPDIGHCMLAVRMAVGDVFKVEKVDSELFGPMAAKVRQITAEKPGIDRGAAIDQAVLELQRQKVGEALIQEKFRYKQQEAKFKTLNDVDAMLAAKLKPHEVVDSLNVGSEKQATGAAFSTDAIGQAMSEGFIQPLRTAIEARPGLADKYSDWRTLGSERDLARATRRQVARLAGNASVDVTDDEDVNVGARAISGMQRDVREALNRAGAWVPKLEGWSGRQNHDARIIGGGFYREVRVLFGQRMEALKALASGEGNLGDLVRGVDWHALQDRAEVRAVRTWVDSFRDKIDPKTWENLSWDQLAGADEAAPRHEQMVLSVTPELAEEGDPDIARRRDRAVMEAQALYARGVLDDPQDMKGLLLYRMFQRIMGGRADAWGGAFGEADFVPQGANYSRARSQARVLILNGPDAESDYAERWTRGTYYSQVIRGADRAGRNVALLNRYGPDPDQGFKDVIAYLQEKNRQAGGGQAGLGGLMTSGGQLSPRVRAGYEIVSGVANIPVSLRTAELFQNARAWEAVTKLGSVPLSKIADVSYGAQAIARYGNMEFGKAYDLILREVANLPDKEAKMAADAVGAGTKNFVGRMNAGWANGGSPGSLAWGTQMLYRISGFNKLTELVQRVVVNAMQALYGGMADLKWSELPQSTRETFLRHAIVERDWDLVREGLPPATDANSSRYLTLEHVDDRVAQDPHLYRDAEAAKLKFKVLYQNVMNDAVNEPRGREAQIARTPFGSRSMLFKPGTVEGELMHSFWQFKGFVTSALMRHMIPAAQSGRPVAMLAHLMISSTIAGYLTLQAKAIARGELPKSAKDIADAEGISLPRAEMGLWTAAFAQGGGLGMYGDFLFGEFNRSGQKWSPAQMGGPLISDTTQLANILWQTVHGGAVNDSTGRSQMPGELAHLAASNVPLINTWYTRVALDYLLLWRLQEAASPGYLQRYQDKMERKSGARYWAGPTSAQ
jgi:hypothetical protein